MWDELGSYNDAICTCEANNKRRKLMQFLMGLNESYSVVRGQLLLMNPLPDVSQAYSSIIREEKQRNLGIRRETIEVFVMIDKRRNQQPLLFSTNLVSLLVPIPIIVYRYIVPTITKIITQGRHVGSYMINHQDSPSIPRIIISSPTIIINLQQIMPKKPYQHMFSPFWMDWLNYNYNKFCLLCRAMEHLNHLFPRKIMSIFLQVCPYPSW